MQANYKASGAEALFLAAITYALTGILVRLVSPMWGDNAQVAARFVLVLVFLGGYCLLRRQKIFVPKAKLKPAFGLALAFAAMVLFFTFAINKTTVANVLFVFYASNMVSSFMAGTLVFKETITRNKLLALAFALGGLALYSGAIGNGNLGIVFALLAGLFSGGVNISSKALAGVERNAVLITQYGIASVFTVLLTLFSGDAILRTASLYGTLLTTVFALIIILGSSLTLYGFQNFDVNIGSVIISSELVFATILGYILFAEVPAGNELAGGILVFIGSIIGSGIFDRSRQPINQTAQPD